MNLILWIAAIAYALWPMDLLPDVFVGLGWLDDLILLFLAWRFMKRGGGPAFFRGANPFAGGRRSGTQDRRPGGDAGSRHAGRDRTSADRPPADPYTRLGVGPDAGAEEIKQAYRALAAQYHPDKVAHLGKEFQEMAEERFKQIQEAYQELKRLGRV